MKGEIPSFNDVVAAMLALDFNPRMLDRIQQICGSVGDADLLVNALVARQYELSPNQDTALQAVYQSFEALAEHNTEATCILMAHFWPIASTRVGMHEICDSIDLWLSAHSGSSLTPHYRFLSESSGISEVKRHFSNLLSS